MKFIYRGTTYEYNEDRLTFGEAKAFEKKAGAAIPQLQTGQAIRDSQVIQAMLWSAMKRQEPTLKFEDLEEIPYEEFEFLPESESLPDRVESLTTDLVKFAAAVLRDDEIPDELGQAYAQACDRFAGELAALIPADEDPAPDPSGPPDPPVAASPLDGIPTVSGDETQPAGSTGSG